MCERKIICNGAPAKRNFAVSNPKLMFVMKLVNFVIVALLAANTAIASCSSSRVETDGNRSTRTVSISANYSSVKSSNGLNVIYEARGGGSTTVCRIEGPRELVERVETKVKDGVLRIRTRDGRGISKEQGRPTVYVTGRPVSAFEASSGSVLSVKSALSAKGTFEAEVSSGAILNFPHKITCRNFEAEFSSGGVINMEKLECSATLELEGSSGGVFNATAECVDFEVDLSSGAVLKLKGKAERGEIDASSGAVVECKGMNAGTVEVDASSGAVVSVGQGAKISKSSGAIVK